MRKVPIVYLAGGMKSVWQDDVKKLVSNCIFIDPRDHGLNNEVEYTNWDLTGVDIADIIYVYAEVDNPSCIGLAVEVGWAAKAGKTIVYVEPDNHPKHTSLGMVRALANYRSNNFYTSIYMLESIVNPKETS